MKMILRARKSLEDLLEEGLESASQGYTFYSPSGLERSTIQEIDDLLKVAQLVKKAVAVEPDPRARAAIRYRLLAHAEAQPRGPLSGLIPLFRLRRPLALAVFAALLLSSAPAAALAASRDALPGEPLYPVKEAWENVQLMLARGDEAKAGAYARFALRLTEDLSDLDHTDKQIPPETVLTLASHTGEAVSAIEKEDKPAAIGQQVLELTQREQEVLTAIAAKSPEVAQPAIRRALDLALRGHKIARERLEDRERTKQRAKGNAISFGQDESEPRPTEVPDSTCAPSLVGVSPKEIGESIGREDSHEGALTEHPSANQNDGHESETSATPGAAGVSVGINRGDKERTEQRDEHSTAIATPTAGPTPRATLPAEEQRERERSHDRREISTPETKQR